MMAYRLSRVSQTDKPKQFKSKTEQECFYIFQIALIEPNIQDDSNLPDKAMPVRFATIRAHQGRDKNLQEKVKKSIHIQNF